jgi:hypothetical protein
VGDNPNSIGDAHGLAARAVARASRRQGLWLALAVVAVLALPFVAVAISALL